MLSLFITFVVGSVVALVVTFSQIVITFSLLVISVPTFSLLLLSGSVFVVSVRCGCAMQNLFYCVVS